MCKAQGSAHKLWYQQFASCTGHQRMPKNVGVKCGTATKVADTVRAVFSAARFGVKRVSPRIAQLKAHKEHRILVLKDLEDQDMEDLLEQPVFCRQKHHEKEKLEFFCQNWVVAICVSYVATIHDGHAKILLEEAAS